jgi:hypothetical protein
LFDFEEVCLRHRIGGRIGYAPGLGRPAVAFHNRVCPRFRRHGEPSQLVIRSSSGACHGFVMGNLNFSKDAVLAGGTKHN